MTDAGSFLPLPSATLHILVALGPGEKHGYAIMGDVEELSDGRVRMGPGTLYGSIKRMLADGLIEETLFGEHINWAIAPFVVMFGATVPLLINPAFAAGAPELLASALRRAGLSIPSQPRTPRASWWLPTRW